MNTTPDFFETIRASINVSDIVRQKVTLKRRGAEFVGLCPFHTEKSPSFTVNDAKRFYYCFGCQAHGDAIKFTSETAGLKYKDAAIKLAGEYGIEIPKMSKTEEKLYEEIDQIHHVLNLTSEFFQTNMTDIATQYLLSRHLNTSIIQNYKIGYAPGGKALREYLEQRKIPLMMMNKAGLICKGEDGSIYETFRDRIIFPIRNIYGKVIGFGGRAMGNAMPKYLNSPETIVFKKNDTLYGEDTAMGAAYKTGQIIVVEGYMDLIAMQTQGFANSVASLGTAVTINHMTKLWHAADEIVICLDGDVAGLRASKKVIEKSLSIVTTDKNVSFMLMPQNQDPDDVLSGHGTNYMQGLFNARLSMAEMLWYLEIKEQTFTTPERRASLEQRLQNHANTVTDPTLRRNYSRFFKEQSWQYFSKKNIQTKPSSIPTLSTTIDENEIIEHSIFALLIKCPELLYVESIQEGLSGLSFHNDLLSELRHWLLMQASAHSALNTELLQSLVKTTSFTEIFMLSSSPNFMLTNKHMHIEKHATVLWDILIKKHHLIKSKSEYAALMTRSDDEAFNKARKYQKEILRIQKEIDLISDNLMQHEKYE